MERKFDSISDMIESIPEDRSIKEKARDAYIKLGLNSFYNPKYKHLFGYPQIDIFNESFIYTTPNIRCM